MDLLYTFWVDASTENIYLGNDDSLAKIINVLRSFRCLCVASALKRQILSDRAQSIRPEYPLRLKDSLLHGWNSEIASFPRKKIVTSTWIGRIQNQRNYW
jgi:hypothetical protein